MFEIFATDEGLYLEKSSCNTVDKVGDCTQVYFNNFPILCQ